MRRNPGAGGHKLIQMLFILPPKFLEYFKPSSSTRISRFSNNCLGARSAQCGIQMALVGEKLPYPLAMTNETWASLVENLFPSSAIGLIGEFSYPPIAARPKIRWWWPHGMVDPGEISNEINQIFGAGFGGAEIEDVHLSITVSVHPDGHGWATDPWITAVNTASQHAKSPGLQIDISFGPSYPASVPTLRPDDDGAAKEVVSVGFLWANGSTYSGAISPPYVAAKLVVYNQSLLALQAWRMNAASKTTAVQVALDSNSLIGLTNKVSNGNITWTPPDNGT
jgi:hypothetical protein